MSDALYAVTDKRIEGVPGGRINSFRIDGQSGRIFVGELVFSDISGNTDSLSWRASYTGPTTGYTIHERTRFQEKLHSVPAVNSALKRFISEHITAFREAPAQPALFPDKLKDAAKCDNDGGRTTTSEASAAGQQSPESRNSNRSKEPLSLEETARVFPTLSDRLRLIASYLAEDVGTQQIADSLVITKDTLKGYFCQLREKFSMGVPELRALFRSLFAFDATLRISTSTEPPAVETTTAARVTVDVPAELFGKEVLQTFSQRERAVASLFARGLTLSQIASKTNLRLSDVGICKAKLKRFLRCDDTSLLSRLKDIAEGKTIPVLARNSEGKENVGQNPHIDELSSSQGGGEELQTFLVVMQAVEEFRAKLSSGYELSLGDCVVVPGGNVVSVSIRVKQAR